MTADQRSAFFAIGAGFEAFRQANKFFVLFLPLAVREQAVAPSGLLAGWGVFHVWAAS